MIITRAGPRNWPIIHINFPNLFAFLSSSSTLEKKASECSKMNISFLGSFSPEDIRPRRNKCLLCYNFSVLQLVLLEEFIGGDAWAVEVRFAFIISRYELIQFHPQINHDPKVFAESFIIFRNNFQTKRNHNLCIFSCVLFCASLLKVSTSRHFSTLLSPFVFSYNLTC